MSYRIPIIFDTDIGVDDAFALLLAAGNTSIDILGITTVFGNNSVDNCTENALRICELLDINVPVAKGARKSLFGEEKDYTLHKNNFVHGADGLGGKRYMLKDPRKKVEDCDAVDLIARLVRRSDEKVVLVPVGPLTNIAMFLLTYPELKPQIDGIALMGGAAYGGNYLPLAESNIANDPEAAKIVFQSGLKLVMCGLDATEKAMISKDDREMLRVVGGNIGSFYYEMVKDYVAVSERFDPNRMGPCLHDSVPVAWLINPDIVKTEPCHVDVDIIGQYSKGCTVTDVMCRNNKPNAMVAFDIDREEFIKLHLDALKWLNRNQ